MLTIGERFDRYTIEALLGAGGMGEVYRAFDPRLERRVALKVLHQDPASDDLAASSGHAARLLREARAAAALDHPNVVAIFDVGEVGDTTFLAMELIAGQSLRDLISADVPLATRLVWLAEIAATLGFAHDRGLVHRDIKPENIMVRSDGVLKVLDFGIARRTRVVAPTGITLPFHPANLGRLTGDGSTIAGTPHYMAPEQMQGGAIDGRADQFAWGIVAYELLTGGTMPWPHATDIVTLIAAVTGMDPVPLPPVPGLPAHTRDVVMRALRRDPGQRFASMTDLVAALGDGARPARLPSASMRAPARPPDVFAETLNGLPVAQTVSVTVTDAEPEPEPSGQLVAPAPPRRRAWRLAGAAATILALGTAAAVLLADADDPPGAAVTADGTAASRRTIAVIGFRNLSGREDVGWIATALAEMLTTELAIGEQLRTVAVDDVERMKRELALAATDSLGQAQLASVGRRLRTDLVVTGNYLAIGEKVRLDIRLIDVASGEALVSLSESDRETELIDLVSRTGASLRRTLHTAELSPEQAGDLRASVPATPEGARLYATGRASLRAFDATRARASFEQLTAREPQFALGHLALADALTMLGLSEAATAAAERAMALSGPLPRAERMVIEVRYHVEKAQWDQAIAVARTLHDLYPDDLEHGLRLAEVQLNAGRHRDAVSTLAGLRRLPAPLGDDPRIDLIEAQTYSQLGDPRVLASAAAALRKAEALGATTLAIRARMWEAWRDIESGATQSAVTLLVALRQQALSLGEPLLTIEITHALSYANIQRDELATALKLIEELIDEARALGNHAIAGDAIILLAHIQLRLGRIDDAERSLGEANQANPSNRLSREVYRGEIAAARGDLAGARTAYEGVLQQYRAIGDERSIAWSFALLADVAREQDRLDDADTLVRESLTLREKLGLAAYLVESRLLAARIALARGHDDEAAEVATASARSAASAGTRTDEAQAWAVAAVALRAAGRDDGPALARAKELGPSCQTALARLRVGIVVALADGPPDRAIRTLDEIQAEARRLGLVVVALDAHLAAARVQLAAGRKLEAGAAATAIVAEAERLGLVRIAREARALQR